MTPALLLNVRSDGTPVLAVSADGFRQAHGTSGRYHAAVECHARLAKHGVHART
jgi:hypothetical protein